MTKEEAIKIVRNIYQTDAEKEALAVLVPELAESEDERIRKEIIDYLHLVGKGDGDYAQPMIDRWIAYLENQECGEKGMKGPQETGDWRRDNGVCKKQKEQKGLDVTDYCQPIHPDIAKVLPDVINELIWDEDEHKEQKPNIEICPHSIKSKSYSEQKPTEKQDYSGLTDFERAIHRGFLCACVENVPVEIIKETAQDCLAQMKPAEWNEEDSKRYISIGTTLETSTVLSKEDYDANMVWLRDLVNFQKYSSSRPHWKPSEEQMNALKNIAYGSYQIGDGPVLRELYDNLKKL